MIKSLLEDCNARVEEKFNQYYPDSNNIYGNALQAARYSLFSGGKRIRPFILTEFYKLCGGKDDKAIDLAVSLEMIHTYSLIHDDLPCMDNDDMRRGNPSCHNAFGEDIALLAGDTLLTEAFKTATKTEGIPSDRVIKAISVLAEKSGINGMIGGQVIDILTEGTPVDIDTLSNMYLKKTGCLLEAAAEIGCILAGADNETIKNASDYAKNLGLAFQVIDDILDSVGNEKLLGKPIGSDEKNDKTTFVTLYGVEKSKEIATELTNKALSSLQLFKGDTCVLKELTEFLLSRNN